MDDSIMRWLAALLVALTGCSATPTPRASSDEGPDRTEQSRSVLLITRPEGKNDWAFQGGEGRLRVREDCILLNGQLVVFPYGTRLLNEATAVQIDDDSEPMSLTGEAVVHVSGSNVPIGVEGDWDHAMDEENLARWSRCGQRVNASEYADWWLVSDMRLD